ncbi:MAG: pyrimidine 5'-nucleotidase [Marinovum sp.]|nr:pyrimidine 5'-nucleotidase [Marinovum sp.]
MSARAFENVTTWVFDLDNTLYDPAVRLFDQIEPRMTAWVMKVVGVDEAEADMLRQDYWGRYGTTWAGLVAEHDMDLEAFLWDVHQIDFSGVSPVPGLGTALDALPGRKVVFTNGTADYARDVLDALEIKDVFNAIYGVHEAGLRPKPDPAAFEAVFAKDGLDPHAAAMFEDVPRNLEVPHAMGLRTVLVAPEHSGHPHIHHHTDDLPGFLNTLT